MKLIMILLTVLVIAGLAGGVLLCLTGSVPLAGVVWAVTLILCCIARRIALYRSSKTEEQK